MSRYYRKPLPKFAGVRATPDLSAPVGHAQLYAEDQPEPAVDVVKNSPTLAALEAKLAAIKGGAR